MTVLLPLEEGAAILANTLRSQLLESGALSVVVSVQSLICSAAFGAAKLL